VVWSIITIIFIVLVSGLVLSGQQMSDLDMLLGMGLGMSIGTIMMIGLKRWRTKRRVNRIINDIVQTRKKQTGDEGTKQVQEESISL